MFGLGLGGFVTGLERGIAAQEDFEDRRERRAERQERREERARERQNQEQIAGIGRAANEEIAGGANREDVEARYWRQIQDTYAAQGRPDLARQFQQWVRGDEASPSFVARSGSTPMAATASSISAPSSRARATRRGR